ncbi:MAG: type II toxin-antitoxin system RelE/ParE family toxin [Terracidiphilus sp.]|jgi:toxin ParE1/3/4
MAFMVRFSIGAHRDLRAIHAYIHKNDSRENADYVARGIVRTALKLRDLPVRGAHPPELLRLKNFTYRQIFFKPYRIVYRIRANTVFIALIADGRRDMKSLLMQRFKKDLT